MGQDGACPLRRFLDKTRICVGATSHGRPFAVINPHQVQVISPMPSWVLDAFYPMEIASWRQ